MSIEHNLFLCLSSPFRIQKQKEKKKSETNNETSTSIACECLFVYMPDCLSAPNSKIENPNGANILKDKKKKKCR